MARLPPPPPEAVIPRPTARAFNTGDELYAAFEKFEAHVKANPLIHHHQTAGKGGQVVNLNDRQMQPMTIISFMRFCHLHPKTWFKWRKDRPDLLDAMEAIDAYIYDHKYIGAAAGSFNASIVMRDIGLYEKVHNINENTDTTVGPAFDPLDIPNLVHPDAPYEDQISETPLLFSQRQLDAGVPYPMRTIPHAE